LTIILFVFLVLLGGHNGCHLPVVEVCHECSPNLRIHRWVAHPWPWLAFCGEAEEASSRPQASIYARNERIAIPINLIRLPVATILLYHLFALLLFRGTL
jgi:hypothetical protein